MKKINYILILFLVVFLGIGGVKAENLSNISIKFDEGNELKNSYLDSFLTIEMENPSDNEYRVLITKENSNLPNSISNPEDAGLIYLMNESGSNKSYIYGNAYFEYASMYGDAYFTFYEYDGNTFNKVSEPILFKRPVLLPFTHRIVSQFYSDKSLGIKINDIYNEKSTVKFKIGKVNDVNLLKKLDGSNNSAYEELLNYAKNDKNPNQTNSIKLPSRDETADTYGEYQNLYDPAKIEDGSYYYGYLEIDTENGKYKPLVDVALYKVEENGALIQANYHNQITGNPDDSNNEQKVENPKTGNSEYTLMFVALITLGTMAFYRTKKYEKFPRK